jgi:hypothetical protein
MKNNNSLVWVALVISIIALVAVVSTMQSPSLALASSGQFRVTSVSNTDPSATCQTVCTKNDYNSFCIGSERISWANFYTFSVNAPAGTESSRKNPDHFSGRMNCA